MKHRFAKPAARKKSALPGKLTKQVELCVDHVGARGDGVAFLDGQPVFIPLSVPQDRVSARIDGKRGDGLTAQIVQVTQAGPDRTPPPCPLFGQCGGCALQHWDENAYTAWKRGLLITQLARHGIDAPVAELIRVPPHSRRRANFTFVRPKGQVVLGYNERASHRVIEISDCLLLDPAIPPLLAPLKQMLARIVADGEEGEVTVTLSETGPDILVQAEARLDLFEREYLADFAESAGLARLSWQKPGSGFAEPIARRVQPVVRFAGIGVEPAPGAFLQPSLAGEQTIARLVCAALPAKGLVADLYCGCGSFTFPLAAQGLSVRAYEGLEAPVTALRRAANAAQLPITVEMRDLARRPLLSPDLKGLDGLVFDPPRAGAAEQAEQLAQFGPPRLVAVSCNPATLARDLKTLTDGGYGVDHVTPIDQFPFTAHLEAVAVLSRIGGFSKP